MKKSFCKQKGFTLVELMVVVTIIAILASVGLPKMTAFVRTSETTEAVEISARIVKSLIGYIESHPEITAASEFNTRIGDTVLDKNAAATNQLTILIPHMVLPPNTSFKYAIKANVDSARGMKACITATRIDKNGGVVSGYGNILISSEVASEAGWEGNVYRRTYLEGSGTPVDGGVCKADGTVKTS
ncbi:MAG: type II secretion system protein [Magnetococcales bacterium]|nr:type II secretion system protein [Magnetococcales bacterium]